MVIAKLGATFPGETVCRGPAETLGKAGLVGSSLCKWSGTRSVQERLCAQQSRGTESTGRINVWESAWREEGCRAGVARGSGRILNFSYWCGVLEKVQE